MKKFFGARDKAPLSPVIQAGRSGTKVFQKNFSRSAIKRRPSPLSLQNARTPPRRSGIPRDQWPKVIAIGNGSEEQDVYSTPSLSVVEMPMEQMAAECLRLLLERMEGRDTGPEIHMLPLRYIPRESCGPLTDENF